MKRIQTRVSVDLTKYTENFFFGMSLRQTLLSAAGVCATALSYIFLVLPGIIAIGFGIPFFALAFLKPDGLPVEKWAAHWLRAHVLTKKVRVYHPENDLYEFLWNGRLCGKRVLRKKELRALKEKEVFDEAENEMPRSRECPEHDPGPRSV